MSFAPIARLFGAALLTAGLAGCIDATIDLEVTSETEAKAISTTVIDKAMLDMVQGMAAGAGEDAEIAVPGADDFCPETGTQTTEGDKITCVDIKEGSFAELNLSEDDGGPQFTSAGPGLVRVAFPTKDLANQVDPSAGAEGEAMDPQTKAMMDGFFAGHFIKIIVRGVEVTDTNMDLSDDKKSAEKTIQWLDLMGGEVEFPDELYAVVRVN